jgi:hypothetical protein
MAKDPQLGYKVVAIVTEIKGKCMLGTTKVRVSRKVSMMQVAFADRFTTTSSPASRLSSLAEVCPGGREILYNLIAPIQRTR